MVDMSDEFCDVVCVGSGAGGLSAAITTGHAGAEVTVVEATARLGGATAYSGGQVWCGSSLQATAAGLPDTTEDAERYLVWLVGRTGRGRPAQRLVTRGADVLRFLGERGVALRVVRGLPDYYYPEAPGSKMEGRIHEIEPFDQAQLGALDDLVATSPYGAGWVSSQDPFDSGGQAPTPELESRKSRHVARGERCGGPGLARRSGESGGRPWRRPLPAYPGGSAAGSR